MPYKSFLIFIIAFCLSFNLKASEDNLLVFKGYLSSQQIESATKKILADSKTREIIIYIDSSNGDINAVMEFARKLYIIKTQQKLSVIVYIADKAIGPAAVLPFLADKLYISPFVSWGDIPLGNEDVIPANLLRNRVVALIGQNPQQPLLALIASAMSDKAVQIVDDHGWKQSTGESQQAISMKGEALIINQNQLLQQNLTAGVMSPSEFLKKWNVEQEKTLESTSSIDDELQLQRNLLANLTSHIKYNTTGTNVIGHIFVGDRSSSITQATWLYVKNALEQYKKTKPAFVILELNTPGGEVYPAQQISDALKELDTQYGIPVVCYINNWAISAGAMLAYSCRFISVVKDASMGAAEPVILGEGNELKTASEKVNSALRTDFANRAAYYDRNPYLAEAMVDKDIILIWRHGQVIKLENDTQIRSTGMDPDIVISPKGKLLTLTSEEMMRYRVADLYLGPTQVELLTIAEEESGHYPASKMLLFQAPFFKDIPNAVIDSYKMDWKDRFFAFLASPMMSSMLLLGLIVGIYIEISTPGFGIAGSVAVICLILIVLSSFALQIASWLELALLLVGIGIILIDLFFLPTFGLLGFAGVLFFTAGLLGLLIPGINAVEYEVDTQTLNAAGQEALKRLGWFSGTILTAAALIVLLTRYFTPRFAGYSRLVLSGNEQDASKGYIAGNDPSTLPIAGSKGTAIATLRPAGKVLIGGKIHDALSSGGFIEKGLPIYVVRLEGSDIIVNVDRDTHD